MVRRRPAASVHTLPTHQLDEPRARGEPALCGVLHRGLSGTSSRHPRPRTGTDLEHDTTVMRAPPCRPFRWQDTTQAVGCGNLATTPADLPRRRSPHHHPSRQCRHHRDAHWHGEARRSSDSSPRLDADAARRARAGGWPRVCPGFEQSPPRAAWRKSRRGRASHATHVSPARLQRGSACPRPFARPFHTPAKPRTNKHRMFCDAVAGTMASAGPHSIVPLRHHEATAHLPPHRVRAHGECPWTCSRHATSCPERLSGPVRPARWFGRQSNPHAQ
jgi:hypothetical protein